ncbi:MAG: hypothetical protein M3020_10005, partial [Myxococcota bacterium]|nr:hypothetical protein [Myxococcota bacterium]
MTACAGRPAPNSPEGTSNPPLAKGACDGNRVSEARAAFAAGRLYPARRLLEACAAEPEARRLLARIELELGNLESAEKLVEENSDEARALEAARADAAARRAATATAFAPELEGIRRQLAQGRCRQ